MQDMKKLKYNKIPILLPNSKSGWLESKDILIRSKYNANENYNYEVHDNIIGKLELFPVNLHYVIGYEFIDKNSSYIDILCKI